MAKTLCKIFGVVFVLVGIAGFLRPDLLGAHLTPVHNIVHLLTGAISLYFGFAGSDSAARSFCQIFGVIYLILGVVGFVRPDVIAAIIQAHGVEGASLMPDNVIHIVLGAVFLIVGLLPAQKQAAA
jgi:hypothetical protein